MSSVANESASKSILSRYANVRDFTRRLVEPLSPEDCMVQSMEDASPARWHLAHTTWFFETFLLSKLDNYEIFDPGFNYLFNSYYNQIGDQFPRPRRGLISRPGLTRIEQYRAYVDEHMLKMLEEPALDSDVAYAVEVGLNHEQQHQELMLTDIKHALSCNPSLPSYHPGEFRVPESTAGSTGWIDQEGGLTEIGHSGIGFCFDNENPRHRVFLEPFSIARQPLTNAEVISFMEGGGYERPEHWLSLGWSTCQQENWTAPLYWLKKEGIWWQFTLGGLQPVDLHAPACHLSYFEADAIARWFGCRLPTEFEWEFVCAQYGRLGSGAFADTLLGSQTIIHPWSVESLSSEVEECESLLGSVWEWTSSSYAAYPGYAPPAGALGEYNGKFMCNQYVLRGGSVATSHDHIRTTYRNFFPASARWQFSGCRLARSL